MDWNQPNCISTYFKMLSIEIVELTWNNAEKLKTNFEIRCTYKNANQTVLKTNTANTNTKSCKASLSLWALIKHFTTITNLHCFQTNPNLWKTYQSHMSVLRSRVVLIGQREQPILLTERAAVETDVVLMLLLMVMLVMLMRMMAIVDGRATTTGIATTMLMLFYCRRSHGWGWRWGCGCCCDRCWWWLLLLGLCNVTVRWGIQDGQWCGLRRFVGNVFGVVVVMQVLRAIVWNRAVYGNKI